MAPNELSPGTGRGGLGGPKTVDPPAAWWEKPPHFTQEHSSAGWDAAGKSVAAALRRRNPEKHAKTPHFHSPSGSDLCREASPARLLPLLTSCARSSPHTGQGVQGGHYRARIFSSQNMSRPSRTVPGKSTTRLISCIPRYFWPRKLTVPSLQKRLVL